MSAGGRALLASAVFLVVVAVVMWANTLPPTAAFVLGAGIVLVLQRISKWEDRLEATPAPTAATGFPAPISMFDALKAREDYRLNHDVRDLLTLPCRYGCKHPVTCPFAHSECPHCLEAREKAGLMNQPDLVGDGR